MGQQSLVLQAHVANRIYPNDFYQTFQRMNFDPALDQMLFAYCQLERRMAIKETYRLYTLCTGMFTSLKSNIVMTNEQQLARATEQHIRLQHALAQQCHKVSLHTILIGVMGIIYKCHTELPFNKLGILGLVDRCRVRKVSLD